MKYKTTKEGIRMNKIKTFEESLNNYLSSNRGKSKDLVDVIYSVKYIYKQCSIDKQRVKDAIENISKDFYESGMHEQVEIFIKRLNKDLEL